MEKDVTYYKVYYFSSNFREVRSIKFDDKREALEWFESLPEKQRIEVNKHTESIEVIA